MSAPTHQAVLVDVGYCLLEVSEPVAETYSSIARKHGVEVDAGAVKEGFKVAFRAEWAEALRYQGDGRPFWRHVVAQAVGRCAGGAPGASPEQRSQDPWEPGIRVPSWGGGYQ